MTGDGAVRVVVVPVIRNDAGKVLICRMSGDRGVFPGTWGLPGGGMEPGETMIEALRREVREELGLTLTSAAPLFFKELRHTKSLPDGSRPMLHMIFLLFSCRVESGSIRLNEELAEYAWVRPDTLDRFELNAETLDTFSRMGFVDAPDPGPTP